MATAAERSASIRNGKIPDDLKEFLKSDGTLDINKAIDSGKLGVDIKGSYANLRSAASEFNNSVVRNAENKQLLTPSEQESKLLDLTGQAGIDQAQKLKDGTIFQLDDKTRKSIQAVTKARVGGAEAALEFGLDKASGRAAGGSAGRGLPRGSLRAELQARLSGGALNTFQNTIAKIDESAGLAAINLPRQDAQLRQSLINNPALTALQRTRIGNAELKLRMRDQSFREVQDAKNRKERKGGLFGGVLGKIAGLGVNYLTGGGFGVAKGVLGGFNGGGNDASAIGSSGYDLGGSDFGSGFDFGGGSYA